MGLMDRRTGKAISDEDHLVQSLTMLFSTQIGTRVLVREYGCNLPSMVDKPVNRQWVMDAYATIAQAVSRWEPRFEAKRILLGVTELSQGVITIKLEGIYKPKGRLVKLRLITLQL